jgi:hypothetical protein
MSQIPAMTRLTDMWVGVCNSHVVPVAMAGIMIQGSNYCIANMLPKIRTYDFAMGFCGHIGIIISGSTVAFSDNISQVRRDDSVAGSINGIVTGGSPDSFSAT